MPNIQICLDESGDLGWSFHAPYRAGGSSRYLTIGSLVFSPTHKDHPKRLIKRLYKKFKWPIGTEVKWSAMTNDQKLFFAERAGDLAIKYPNDIKYKSITVKKERVLQHIRDDENKLYNYMIGLSLLDEMSNHEAVHFSPDPRSIKVASGNSMHDYLQTQLWFHIKAKTILTTEPCDSAKSLNMQFADMLSGLVQSHFEDGSSDAWALINKSIDSKTLFFK